MFAKAAALIGEHAEMLSQLDTVGGDGDHGATMVRAMETLEFAIDSQSAKSPSAMLKEAGWSVMNVDGGASSALLGDFYFRDGRCRNWRCRARLPTFR